MDFGSPGLLFSGLIIGMIGCAMFMYGKRMENPKCLATGLVMAVYPIFVHSLLVMWLIAAGCGAALYALQRME